MTEFDKQLAAAWKNHADSSADVAASFINLKSLLTNASELLKLTQLATHVYNEHLNDFKSGFEFLTELETLKINSPESKVALDRSKAVLQLTQNAQHNISSFPISEQIKILTASASADVNFKKIELAELKFKAALDLAETLPAGDGANKSLAMAGNNIACALEELDTRNDFEKNLMVLAALSARKFWGKAGTWLEIERSEYRLAQSYFKANDFISSIKHANLCLTICEKNQASALEFFFAFEAIAQIEKAIKQPLRSLDKMKVYFEQLTPEDQAWCKASLERLQS